MSTLEDAEIPGTESPLPSSYCDSQENDVPKTMYGKLISTTIHLPSIVLDKPEFVLGRATDCDVILTRNNFSQRCINSISSTHFKVTCNPERASVTITDLSKNGTYVNKRCVGKNSTIALNNNDVISIGTSGFKIYMYKSIENSFLCSELQERYQFRRHLGTGACAEVIQVFEKSTCKEYAIKKIVKGRDGNDIDKLKTPVRIHNEITILQCLDHPCVIATKEVVDTDNAVYIVLEYMEGGELADLMMLSSTPLPENIVKILFYQIVMGIRYLHLRNITHRDLKPGNILLKSKDLITVVKIADFGLSKMLESKSLLGTCCGTPYYVAPEVIDPRCGMYTQQADVWSLGVILYQMLSNKFPFDVEGGNQQDMMKMILFGKFHMNSNIWKNVSNAAKDLITKMLVKNPEDRYTIHEVANHPWIAKDTKMQQEVNQLLAKSRSENDRPFKENGRVLSPSYKNLKTD
ncbi:hypothetical protein FQA39_LY08940 [Lamprigera yunnana]|nr:hypothetical protein FQA39_LY08940 [Lamprigera yunnana]